MVKTLLTDFRQMRVKPAELSHKTSFWKGRNWKQEHSEEEESEVSLEIKINRRKMRIASG